ncbi:MAG: hypothetical protein HOA63_00300 [Nitrosopumilus sp.]|jgi:hypothetical protein|nr:hypothetical protein [Nitrosopumilus sp.]MBT6838287.1 hypothetical protein [Nitrosopumilus sp.]
MSENTENLKKILQEYSKKLTKLGSILAKEQFSYKIEEKTSKKYWQKRIEEFKKYNETGLEYYNQVQSMMNVIDKDKGQLFLLDISKFHQLGIKLIKIMETIEETPSIINSKDKQQSHWSKKIKKDISETSVECLDHEKYMNISFREFYNSDIKKILE